MVAERGNRAVTSRPSRRRIARLVLAFLASVFVCDRAMYAVLDWTDRAVDRRPEMRRKLEGVSDRPAYQWLILGTSRTFEALHPALIANQSGVRAFKEASKGKGLRYHYEFYRLYREVVGKPRLVIYGLDYFMFANPSDPGLLRRFGGAVSRASAPTALWPPLLTLAHKAEDDQTILRILEQFQLRLTSAMGEFDPNDDVADMEAYTGRTDSRVDERPAGAGFSTVGYARYPGLEGEFLVKLLRAWQDDGVQVVFVYPPDYEATRRTNIEHDALIAEVRQLTAQCATCAVLDYSSPSSFPTSNAAFFWDGGFGNPNSHLSKAGAEAFTRIFLPDVRRVVSGFARLPSAEPRK
jgi:hypothetical protein